MFDATKPHFVVRQEVTDELGEVFLTNEACHSTLDSACEAYGHAVEGLHKFYRDQRESRAALARALAESEAVATKTMAQPDGH